MHPAEVIVEGHPVKSRAETERGDWGREVLECEETVNPVEGEKKGRISETHQMEILTEFCAGFRLGFSPKFNPTSNFRRFPTPETGRAKKIMQTHLVKS